MKPLPAPAIPDGAVHGALPEGDVPASRRPRARRERIAAWSPPALALLVALAAAALRLLGLPWGLAFPLGLLLGCALGLLAAGIALVAVAVRG